MNRYLAVNQLGVGGEVVWQTKHKGQPLKCSWYNMKYVIVFHARWLADGKKYIVRYFNKKASPCLDSKSS